ncbi:MAG: calcium/sodium antiporter [Gammaproteobacteria bacterium]|nr:calcium/sodium antiporter [Gammaproteobacteria bacterium]MCP5200851.1 calcium/sodium antiporter [Gammaproteobacteria bacterium]
MTAWLITAGQATLGLVLLYFGGEWLVRGAAALAARTGISPLAIGLTVVAFGTSAPELVVSLQAALGGASDIAVGNVVGSNIANVGLILGIAALIRPLEVHVNVLRIDSPLMLAACVLMVALLLDGTVGRGDGAVLVTALVSYIGFTLWQSRRETAENQAEFAAALPADQGSIGRHLLLVGAGLLALVGGGKALVTAAVALATALGVSQAVIGLTVVAVGTSLPELAASIVAALRGQGDIALGNVIGSNLFNVLGILGVTAVVTPLPRGEVGWDALGVMLLFALAVWPLASTGRRLVRGEGALLLGAYGAYVGWLAFTA